MFLLFSDSYCLEIILDNDMFEKKTIFDLKKIICQKKQNFDNFVLSEKTICLINSGTILDNDKYIYDYNISNQSYIHILLLENNINLENKNQSIFSNNSSTSVTVPILYRIYITNTNIDNTNIDNTNIDNTNIDNTNIDNTNIDNTNIDNTNIDIDNNNIKSNLNEDVIKNNQKNGDKIIDNCFDNAFDEITIHILDIFKDYNNLTSESNNILVEYLKNFGNIDSSIDISLILDEIFSNTKDFKCRIKGLLTIIRNINLDKGLQRKRIDHNKIIDEKCSEEEINLSNIDDEELII